MNDLLSSSEKMRSMAVVMQAGCIVAVFLVLLSGLSLAAAEEARLVKVEGTDVCVVTGQGFFPVLCRMENGKIGAIVRGGAMHLGRGGRLDFVKSADNGLTWSKPVVVLDTGLDDRNPAFGQAPNGTLVVAAFRFDKYAPNGEYDSSSTNPSDVLLVYSGDTGTTWSVPRRFPMGDFVWLSPYGKILALDDGTMVLHCYGNAVPLRGETDVVEDENRNASYLFWSKDAGKSWSDPTRIALD